MTWKKTFISLVCFTTPSLYAVPVTDAADLQTAIINNETTIDFEAPGPDNEIDLSDLPTPAGAPVPVLRPLNTNNAFDVVAPQTITINGNGQTLTVSGATPIRGFFVRSNNVVIDDLTFENLTAQGGTSDGAGGGGGGFGGSLFVATGANVTLIDPVFIRSSAIGGDGGPAGQFEGGGGGFSGNGGFPSAGGGGGFAFNGGSGDQGGGGGGATGTPGQNAVTTTGGQGGGDFSGAANGGAGGGPGANGTAGPTSGTGGGGGGTTGNGGAGNFGGGGGGGGEGGGNGGAGGSFGGGGGGAFQLNATAGPSGNGGAGGFGGGGGASGTSALAASSGNGGAGGFGGGGGGSGGFTGGLGGLGGFGGGNGGNDNPLGGGGGGGAGFGGAIFIQSGGSVTIQGSARFSGNTATGGSGGGGGATDGRGDGDDIFMMGGANLTIDNTRDIDIPNPIEGDLVVAGGGLTKQGCALLTLNGANTFTGTTNVQEGELEIEGSVLTDINVSNGAILSGNFVTTGSIDNSGVVSPGDAGVGLIVVKGSFTNQANGSVLLDITPTTGVRDFIFTGAGATLLGGNLDIIVNAGNYIAGTTYTVISGPITGTFANVVQTGANGGLVDIGVSYTNGVVLTILQNFIFQNQTINSGIPRAVSNCIQVADFNPRSDFAAIIRQLGLLNSADLNRALYNMSPVNFGALDWINARNNNYLADILSEHLYELCCSPRDCCSCYGKNLTVWIDVFGNLMRNTHHYGHMNRFNANATGLVVGIDRCFGSQFKLGAAFAYSHTWLDWKESHGHGEIDSYYVALYSSYDFCYFDLDVSVIGGSSDHYLKRRVQINGVGTISTVETDLCAGTIGLVNTPVQVNIDRKAKSQPTGYFFTGHLGLRGDLQWCCLSFEPYAVLDYNYFHRRKFDEVNPASSRLNGLNLHVHEHIQNMLRSELGFKVYTQLTSECCCLAPYIGLSWVGEFPFGHSKQRANFIGHTCTFAVDSYDSSVQLVSPQAGVKWTSCGGFSLLLGYKGLYNGNTLINQADLRFEFLF